MLALNQNNGERVLRFPYLSLTNYTISGTLLEKLQSNTATIAWSTLVIQYVGSRLADSHESQHAVYYKIKPSTFHLSVISTVHKKDKSQMRSI